MTSIPELAIKMVEENISNVGDNASTIFMVGSKSAGKTTLLHSFLDKTDKPKETLVLEYSFGRKTVHQQGIDKTVCHVWDYGGHLDMMKSVLPSIPVKGNFTFCLMVDLSRVKQMWCVLETCLEAFRDFSSGAAKPEIVLIGGKYDEFKNFDTELRKTICTAIRSLGVLLELNIFFYSSKDAPLLRRAKDVLHNISFGSGFPAKEKVVSVSKPLYICKGTDSWESVGVTSCTMEQIKSRFVSTVPQDLQESPARGLQLTTTATAYPEPVLDALVAARLSDLRDLDVISGF